MMYEEQLELFPSSWALNAGFEELDRKLQILVPLTGKVPKGRSKNKCLEKYRVASNLLYDLFNNGLMNRRSHFHKFFRPVCSSRRLDQRQFNYLNKEFEPIFTSIIQAAAKEQGVK